MTSPPLRKIHAAAKKKAGANLWKKARFPWRAFTDKKALLLIKHHIVHHLKIITIKSFTLAIHRGFFLFSILENDISRLTDMKMMFK